MVNTLDTRATLYGYLPVKGNDWASSAGKPSAPPPSLPNSSAPAPLNAVHPPARVRAAGDERSPSESDFPNTGTSSDAYATMYCSA